MHSELQFCTLCIIVISDRTTIFWDSCVYCGDLHCSTLYNF